MTFLLSGRVEDNLEISLAKTEPQSFRRDARTLDLELEECSCPAKDDSMKEVQAVLLKRSNISFNAMVSQSPPKWQATWQDLKGLHLTWKRGIFKLYGIHFYQLQKIFVMTCFSCKDHRNMLHCVPTHYFSIPSRWHPQFVKSTFDS